MSASRSARGVALLVALALSATGCARARAETAPAPLPMLAPPAPPPRPVVAEYPAEPAAATPVPPAPPVTTASPRTAPRRESVVPAPPPPPPVVAPAGTLQPGREAAPSEAAVRARIAEARRALAQIDVPRLDPDARVQAATAWRFLAQADDALRERTTVLAATLVEKAAAIAAALRP